MHLRQVVAPWASETESPARTLYRATLQSAPEEFRRRTSMEIRLLCAFEDDSAGSSKL